MSCITSSFPLTWYNWNTVKSNVKLHSLSPTKRASIFCEGSLFRFLSKLIQVLKGTERTEPLDDSVKRVLKGLLHLLKAPVNLLPSVIDCVQIMAQKQSLIKYVEKTEMVISNVISFKQSTKTSIQDNKTLGCFL